jgi:Tol biopolymer transport system component
MAYKLNSVTIVDDEGNWVDRSFDSVPDIAATVVKITASDPAEGAEAEFGGSVAVGYGRIVVGASGDDDNGFRSGSVYVYDLDGTNETKITPSDGAAGDFFGYSVAVGCNKIVVGAHGNDDDGFRSGSAYIFDLNGNQLAKITARDSVDFDEFGFKVAVGCNKIVVGARGDDDNGDDSGSVYIYDLDGTNETKITASDGTAGDEFGTSVAVGNGKIVVGAVDNGTEPGSVYIYNLDGTNETKITASDGVVGDEFGSSVAVGNGKIVVGASRDDDNGTDTGSVYIYDLDGTNETKITASDGTAGDRFGWSVAVGNGKIVVSAYLDDDIADNAGSVYIYDLDGTNEIKITVSDGAIGDRFGRSVAVGNGKIVVGAYDDGSLYVSGSAYIYNLPETTDIYWENIIEGFRW